VTPVYIIRRKRDIPVDKLTVWEGRVHDSKIVGDNLIGNIVKELMDTLPSVEESKEADKEYTGPISPEMPPPSMMDDGPKSPEMPPPSMMDDGPKSPEMPPPSMMDDGEKDEDKEEEPDLDVILMTVSQIKSLYGDTGLYGGELPT